MNKLITNTLLAPTPSATGTIGTVVEHVVILFGFPPVTIRSNPGHPTVFKFGRTTLLILVGCTALLILVFRALDAKSLTLVAIALQVNAFAWTIGTILSPPLVVPGSSTTTVLVFLVIFIIQGGINRSCTIHDSLVVCSGGRGSWLRW